MSRSTQSPRSVTDAVTPDELFRLRAAASPDAQAYRYHDNLSNQWHSLTWAEMAQQILRWQAALTKENLEPGDRVAFAMRNGPE